MFTRLLLRRWARGSVLLAALWMALVVLPRGARADIATHATVELGKKNPDGTITWLKDGETFRPGAWRDLYRLGAVHGYARSIPWRTQADATLVGTAEKDLHATGSEMILSHVLMHGGSPTETWKQFGAVKDQAKLLGMDMVDFISGGDAILGGSTSLGDLWDGSAVLGLFRVTELTSAAQALLDSIILDKHNFEPDRFVVAYPHPQYDVVRIYFWVDSNDEPLLEAVRHPRIRKDNPLSAAIEVLPDVQHPWDPRGGKHDRSDESGRRCGYVVHLDRLAATLGARVFRTFPFECEYGEKDDALTAHTLHSRHVVSLVVRRQMQPPIWFRSSVSHEATSTAPKETVAAFDLDQATLVDGEDGDGLLGTRQVVILRGQDGRHYVAGHSDKPYDELRIAATVQSARVLDRVGWRLRLSGQWIGPSQADSVRVVQPPDQGELGAQDGAGRAYAREGTGTVELRLRVADLPDDFDGNLVVTADYAPPAGAADSVPAHPLPSASTIIRVTLVRSTLGTSVRVPDLTALSREQSARALAQAGLRGEEHVESPSSGAGHGAERAWKQSPRPGTVVGRDATVRYWVSPPEAVSDATRVRVPQVEGLGYPEAVERELGRARLIALDGGASGGPDPAFAVAWRCTDQTPKAGTEVAVGSAVVILREPSLVRVPPLVGLQENDALKAARRRGFELRVAFDPPESRSGLYLVVSQSPAAEAAHPPGSGTPLTVVLRRHAEAPPPPRPATVRVPDLRGLSDGQALEALRAARLAMRRVEQGAYAAGTPLRVDAQNPQPGAEVGDGTEVTVYVSAVPLPPAPPSLKDVPALVGKTEEAAVHALMSVGLRSRVLRSSAPGVKPWVVIQQFTAPGQRAPSGSTVEFQVALTPQPRPVERRPVPDVRGLGWPEAQARLKAAGFIAALPVGAQVPTRSSTVRSSSPPAGAAHDVGARVTLYLLEMR